MSNKVIGDYTAAISIDGSTDYLLIQPGSSSVAYNKINRNVFLGVTGQPADISTIQTFSNKILDNTNTITVRDGVFTIQDDVDLTKQARFQLSGITTATTRTYTLPNASSTLADISTAQTFTNKTLTAPVISGGTIDNSTITVDAIGEHTVNNGVTIDGLNIMNGALNTNNSVVTSNITDGAVTPAKLQTGAGAGWSSTSYSPTLTNFTLGNGTVNYALFGQTGKTVRVRIGVTLGSTSSVSGQIFISLPVTASPNYAANSAAPVGKATIVDVSTAAYFNGTLTWSTTTSVLLTADNAQSNFVLQSSTSSSVPMVWATGDGFYLEFSYEAA